MRSSLLLLLVACASPARVEPVRAPAPRPRLTPDAALARIAAARESRAVKIDAVYRPGVHRCYRSRLERIHPREETSS